MKKLIKLGFLATPLLFSLVLSLGVSAQIYKSVDANGRVTYSDVPTKGATKIESDSTPNPANSRGEGNNSNKSGVKTATRNATPSDFPRVDKETQTARDGKRKDILLAELEAEKKALEAAKQAQLEGESNPEVYKTANGKTFRNVPKYDEKIAKLKADVASHENNIALLQKEIANL